MSSSNSTCWRRASCTDETAQRSARSLAGGSVHAAPDNQHTHTKCFLFSSLVWMNAPLRLIESLRASQKMFLTVKTLAHHLQVKYCGIVQRIRGGLFIKDKAKGQTGLSAEFYAVFRLGKYIQTQNRQSWMWNKAFIGGKFSDYYSWITHLHLHTKPQFGNFQFNFPAPKLQMSKRGWHI